MLNHGTTGYASVIVLQDDEFWREYVRVREGLVVTAVFSGCGQCHHSEESKAETCSSMALRRQLTVPVRAAVESHAVLSMQQEDCIGTPQRPLEKATST